MIDAEIIGGTAATLTTLAFLPQAVKILRTRDTSSISLGMYLMFCVGLAFWLTYGVMIGSNPVIYSNIFTLAQAVLILAMKLRYK